MIGFLKEHVTSLLVGTLAGLFATGLYGLLGSSQTILLYILAGLIPLIVFAVVFEQVEKRFIRPRVERELLPRLRKQIEAEIDTAKVPEIEAVEMQNQRWKGIAEERPRLWNNRDEVDPSFRQRIESSERSIYLIGLSFETTFINYGEVLGKALKNSVDIRMLVLNPDSLHAEAHEEFREDVRGTIRTVLNKNLKPLYDKLEDKLSPADLGRFTVRATNQCCPDRFLQ